MQYKVKRYLESRGKGKRGALFAVQSLALLKSKSRGGWALSLIPCNIKSCATSSQGAEEGAQHTEAGTRSDRMRGKDRHDRFRHHCRPRDFDKTKVAPAKTLGSHAPPPYKSAVLHWPTGACCGGTLVS